MASQSSKVVISSKTLIMPMVVALIILCLARQSLCERRELELDEAPPTEDLKYHGGPVLHGDIPVSIVLYGKFKPEQKAIVVDFVESLTSKPAATTPSVAQWWSTIHKAYLSKAATTGSGGGGNTRVLLDGQLVADEKYSLGKALTLAQVSQLAAGARPKKGGLVLVLTDADVAVEGFCSIRCGQHGAGSSSWAYAWTGDAATQCPGQCAWPFAKPSYGPQDKPLGAPNGDVGVDGLMVTLASMFAGAVTNPFRDAYYQGERDAALEACTACAGVFGSGSFPGYAGNVLVDKDNGGSYNAVGAGGHKYLLPAIYDPAKTGCSTSV